MTRISSLFPTPDLADALKRQAAAEPLGLYLHIPFCIDRCTYCSFSTSRDHSRKPEVLAKLTREIAQWGEVLGRPMVDTFYLGGGTPSTLTAEELAGLTDSAHKTFNLSMMQEATLEANPGTVGLAWLQDARSLGWDRVSIGIQTLDDELLRRLGRIHDAQEGLNALSLARRAGFERITADLMVGIPGQDLERVLADARRIAEAGANHLSIYMLDLDKTCSLKKRVESGELTLPSEDEVAEVFERLQEDLPSLGLTPYEISNYARPGQESVHNTRYWERRPYLGFGPSAASHLGSWRWTESWNIDAWLDGVAPAELQELTAAEVLAEIPLLGLRLLRGTDWDVVRSRAASLDLMPLVSAWEKQIEPFIHNGLLTREGSILRLSTKGLLLSNAVFEIFV